MVKDLEKFYCNTQVDYIKATFRVMSGVHTGGECTYCVDMEYHGSKYVAFGDAFHTFFVPKVNCLLQTYGDADKNAKLIKQLTYHLDNAKPCENLFDTNIVQVTTTGKSKRATHKFITQVHRTDGEVDCSNNMLKVNDNFFKPFANAATTYRPDTVYSQSRNRPLAASPLTIWNENTPLGLILPIYSM